MNSKFNLKKIIIIFFVIVSLISWTAGLLIYWATPPTKDPIYNFTYPHINQTTINTIQYSTNILPFAQIGGFINDASHLNKTPIFGITRPKSIADLQNTVVYANQNKIPITVAGKQHSMGGQSFNYHGIVIDIQDLNCMQLDRKNKILTTQSGATWRKIQEYLNPENLSVGAMQSINIFSVGGTISVNAHGISYNPGIIAPTIESMQIMLANGSIVGASPTENTELVGFVLLK